MPIILSGTFSKDGSLLAAVNSTGMVLVWRTDTWAGPLFFSLFDQPNSISLAKDKVVLRFLNESTIAVLASGVIHVLQVSRPGVSGLFELVHVGVISPPSGITYVDSIGSSNLVVGTGAGKLCTVNSQGHVCATMCVGDAISCTVAVGLERVLVATKGGNLHLVNLSEQRVVSSLKTKLGGSVTHIAVDPHLNWFCGVVQKGGSSSLVSGSTKSLLTVFESKPTAVPITRVAFAQVASNGLSIIAAGPTPQLLLFSLDLSSAQSRVQFDPEQICAVTDLTSKGDWLACLGVGACIQVLSGFSLTVVSTLVP